MPLLLLLSQINLSLSSTSIYGKIIGKNKVEANHLEKIKNAIKADKSPFNRQNFGEAYANNFAIMYGFGSHLMRGLKKLSAEQNREMKSRFIKEKARRDAIIYITNLLINDVHKTDIHRIQNLIKEYKIDIEDPNISAVTKKQLKEESC